MWLVAAAFAAADPDYEKLLKLAKLTLVEALDKAAAQVAGGTAVSAALEEDTGGGASLFAVHVAKGNKTREIILNAKDGAVVEDRLDQGEDDSKAVAAAKISIKQAIETALKKIPEGKAVTADLDIAPDGTPDYEVGMFAGGKLTRVTVNAVTGKIIEK